MKNIWLFKKYTVPYLKKLQEAVSIGLIEFWNKIVQDKSMFLYFFNPLMPGGNKKVTHSICYTESLILNQKEEKKFLMVSQNIDTREEVIV